MLFSTPYPENALLSFMDKDDDPLAILTTCLAVSKTWHKLASDNSVWRRFYVWRWGKIDDQLLESHVSKRHSYPPRPQASRPRSDFDFARQLRGLNGKDSRARLSVQANELLGASSR